MELLQIAQHVEDLKRATDFYQLLLGEAPAASFDPPGLVFFRLGQTRLLLDRAAPPALLYLRVPDLEATLERLRALGVVVDTDPHLIFHHEDGVLGPAGNDEWQAFVRDSEGNLVGLVGLASLKVH